MKSTIFWDIKPCSPLRVNRRFGGTYRLHMLATCFHAGFLLSLYFDPEDGRNMFLRNLGWFSTDYTALYPRRLYSHITAAWDQTTCSLVGLYLKIKEDKETVACSYQTTRRHITENSNLLFTLHLTHLCLLTSQACFVKSDWRRSYNWSNGANCCCMGDESVLVKEKDARRLLWHATQL
jgi:hypothetical protein